MNNENLFSIIDFGSSKLRLGTFAKHLPNSKYICDERIKTSSEEELNQSLKNIILKTEKEINQHLKKVDVMIDTPQILTVDISIKKKIDQINIDESLVKQFILETKIEIERNYKNFKILHLLILNYILDDKEFTNLPINIKANILIVELKFMLIPNETIDYLRELFKKNQTGISNIHSSSYLKTLNYIKYFENFDTKFFIDIGFEKTSLIIYKKNKLKYINYLSIGGAHITKDISKVLNISLDDSESFKQKINQSNTNINNDKTNDLIIKVIHARMEEIIDLSFKRLENYDFLLNTNSILIFTGDGSKILSKNSIFLKEKYNVFDEMSFFEESSDLICSSGYNYMFSENKDEAILAKRKLLKKGFFEKLFYFFSK